MLWAGSTSEFATEATIVYCEQFYLGCLAHASYLLASQGEAVVVDPQGDVDIYLKAAEEHGAKIRHIFETHLHADFVSGHKELAARTGAKIYIGARAAACFPHVAVQDGFALRVGKMVIKALDTPGHTPESICLVIVDEEKSPQPWAVLTGDTLFIGDVGRPDLSKMHTPAELAGMLYDSLHNKLLALADDVLVFPAHGAGSLCGRNMRAERSSAIGTERLTNYALQIKSRAEFIRQLTANLPTRPEYFLQDAEINRQGASALTDIGELPVITAAELKSMLDEGAVALDVRPGDQFAEAHVPASINIALSGQFASWAGTVLGLSAQPILIAESPEQLSEARLRLARVGIVKNVAGYLQGGLAAWKQARFALAEIPQITVQDLRNRLQAQASQFSMCGANPNGILRTSKAQHGGLSTISKYRRPNIDDDRPVAVHCKGGYRSMIACSLLQRAGFRNVTNVIGGFDAWREAKFPVESETPVEA